MICTLSFIPRISIGQTSYAPGKFAVDTSLRLIICNDVLLPEINNQGKIIFGTDTFDIGPSGIDAAALSNQVMKKGVTYTLYFTKLPIINMTIPDIAVINQINSVSGIISVSDSVTAAAVYNMGITVRGSSSATYPKKSYNFHVQDSSGNDINASFLGLRSDQTWLLLALWDEPLRFNNVISYDLWRKIHTLYYADKEPAAYASVRTRYVEVVINNRYQGLYALSEKMDRKELQLKKTNTNNQVRGELYKGYTWAGGTTFTSAPALPAATSDTWAGWQVDYPDTTDWLNMYNFTKFVVSSDSTTFRDSIFSYVQKQNMIDYFIFLNLLRADDNSGKNVYMAKYNTNEPYFIAPWDLNGSWGYYFESSHVNYLPIISNGMYDRMIKLNPDSFNNAMSKRWFDLRTGVLNLDSIQNNFLSTYNFLKSSGAYGRESLVWAYGLNYSAAELNYVLNWSAQRLSVLDNYFQSLAPAQEALPISLSDFGGRMVNNQVFLYWTVQNVEAIQKYEIQRSYDGIHFEVIDTAGQYSYTYIDTSFNANIVYYRVNVIEKRGNNTLSKIIVVANNKVNRARISSVYPNPANDFIKITYTGNVPQKLTVADANGKVVLEREMNGAEMKIDISRLLPGFYVLTIGSDSYRFVKK